ncbi:MAG: ion transporter [Salibacteraceae bacterium]|nr:ion transporter [Salibacteraceae bacterium]MDP4964351.1 ion transporter [Salibacteraceae bacterium]
MSETAKDKIAQIRERLYIIIFEADTRAGKNFDIALLWAILLSTLIVMLESVKELRDAYTIWFDASEIFFTVIFTIEFILRIWTARKATGYLTSFYGIVDFLSVLPTYLELIITSSQYLMIIRIFRLMRVFRVLKLGRSMHEADALWLSLKSSRTKIGVFLFAVFNVAVIMGTIMYIVEGGENGFTSIPRSIYWAIVTMTTVGFGDIHPHTDLGQFFSVILMILGYGIIAVPTGIVGVEMFKDPNNVSTSSGNSIILENTHCHNCGRTGHLPSSNFCMQCGSEL